MKRIWLQLPQFLLISIILTNWDNTPYSHLSCFMQTIWELQYCWFKSYFFNL